MKNTVLIIDDDITLTDLLSQYLSVEGFLVHMAHDGEQGIKKALNQSFDAIILDVMLPKLNGFEVLKTLRQHVHTPILMLTARGEDIDRIVGLEIGADDYLSKPCNPRELLARLKAILRRTHNKPAVQQTLEHRGLILDNISHTVRYQKTLLDLTNTEFKILHMLMKSPGQAFSKEELTEYGLGKHYTPFDRSIDVHISNLRTKLEAYYPEGDPVIKTVRGFGYLLYA